MIGKKLYKGKYTKEEYYNTAVWCNENNCFLKDYGEYFEVTENPVYVPTIQDRIFELEAQITPRNLRNAIQGDEYAINKINSIEAEIELLRAKITMEGDTL